MNRMLLAFWPSWLNNQLKAVKYKYENYLCIWLQRLFFGASGKSIKKKLGHKRFTVPAITTPPSSNAAGLQLG